MFFPWSLTEAAAFYSRRCVCSAAANPACTYRTTGPVYKPQTWYQCTTCGLTGSEGVCKPCAETCHKGHALSEEKTSSGFFCDCSAHGKCWQLARAGTPAVSPPGACLDTIAAGACLLFCFHTCRPPALHVEALSVIRWLRASVQAPSPSCHASGTPLTKATART